jgi:hypothetical protein
LSFFHGIVVCCEFIYDFGGDFEAGLAGMLGSWWEMGVYVLLVVCNGFIYDFRSGFGAGLAGDLAWLGLLGCLLFVVSGCLMGYHSPDLFSVEGLVVRYTSYLWCTRLRGCSWESARMVQLYGILVAFAWDDSGSFVISLCFGQV